MRTAKSARINVILGASLAAMIVPGVTVAELITRGLSAIDSSSAKGIDSSSALAIDSSSALAIDSSSALAIDSSSALAIDSSSALAIDSSSALAIDSSSALAIDSSSALAIDSSSALAIDSSSIVLAGPVEAIDQKNGFFVSLGQYVAVGDASLDSLAVGDYVLVGGAVTSAGWIDANSIIRSDERYTAGETQVLVTGIPSSVDFSLGTAKIGGLDVDYTPSLGGSGFEGIGAAIAVIGVQPALGGTMLSDRVLDKTELFLAD